MIMRMLAAGGIAIVSDEQRAADADNPLGYFEDARVKDLARDASWVGEARGKALKVVSALLRYLPADERYRVIFVRRDLEEVVASQRAMLTRLGKEPDADEDRRMTELFRRHVEHVVGELRARPEVELLVVEHGDAIQTPREVARCIRDFLAVDLDVEAMAGAVEPTLYRQRRA